MPKVTNSQAKCPDTLSEGRRQPGVIPEVYARHLEEFAFLWGQRQAALRSPDHTLSDVARLEQRLAAHRDGLLLAGEAAIPALEAVMASDDPQAVSAAAYILLSLKIPKAAERVAEAILQAEAEKLEALRQSLCHGPIDLIEKPLREAAASAPAPAAVTALEALAFHRRPDRAVDRLVEFLRDENPQVRRAAWHVMAILDAPGVGSRGGS
jgi:uncharacterized protein (TIGR02270 family)